MFFVFLIYKTFYESLDIFSDESRILERKS